MLAKIRLEDFISKFIRDIRIDLNVFKYSYEQREQIEDIVIHHASALFISSLNLSGEEIDFVMHSIAYRLSEDSLTSIYLYDANMSCINKYRCSEIFTEFEAGIKASINLNPYIAQYERI